MTGATVKNPGPLSRAMLSARAVRKVYGRTVALDGFDLELAAGRIVGLVGNNGAGKSTALKILCGVLEPTSGQAMLRDRPTLEAAVRSDIGFVPEDSPLYEDETPLSYLRFFGGLYGVPRAEADRRSRALLAELRLGEEHWRKPIGELSKGSARKVAIARALLHDPPVLILDEPASGLDPATRRELDGVLDGLRKKGKAVLLSAHNLSQVEALCDEIVLLHAGRVAARGSLEELRRRWGVLRYRLYATKPFPGSRPTGSVHTCEFASLRDAESAMQAVRQASGDVVELQSVPPPLEDILRAATGA